MKIELKNFKYHPDMSEETSAFSANIHIDGQLVGFAKNDGHGGCTNYHAIDHKFFDMIRKAEEWAEQQPDIVYPADEFSPSFSVKCDLEHVIDQLCYELIEKSENERLRKYVVKHQVSKILVGTKKDGQITAVTGSYKYKHPIETMLADQPKGIEFMKEQIVRVKKELAKGEVILNNNIPSEMLNGPKVS